MSEDKVDGNEGIDSSEPITPAVKAEELARELSPERTAEFSEVRVQELLTEFQEDFQKIVSDVDELAKVTNEQAVVLRQLALTELPRLQEMAAGTSIETSIKGLIALILSAVKDMEEPDNEQPSNETSAGNLELRKRWFISETLGSDSTDTLLRTSDNRVFRNNDQQIHGSMDNLRYTVTATTESHERDLDSINRRMAEIEQHSLDITDSSVRSDFDRIASDLHKNVIEGVREQIRRIADDVRTDITDAMHRAGDRANTIYQEKFPPVTS